MAILHKNINAEGDIHNPKWFSGANNGDVAWRNELGVLESTDELVLPAALNFVDGSAAPPTSNSGDIYVLSSGASVNAGWGTVALGDWVRYDGTNWNLITPQKSSLCYNETLDKLFSYSGSVWSEVGAGGGGGGNTIYNANDTVGASRVATLTDTLRFKSGIVEVQGSGISGSSLLSLYDENGASTVKLWDFLDNGNVNLGSDSIINLGANNNLTIENSGASSNFQINADSGGYFLFNRSGGLKVVPSSAGNDSIICRNTADTVDVFNVEKIGGGYWNANGGVNIGADDGVTDFANFSIESLNFYANGSLRHQIGYKDANDDVFFNINGALEGRYFIVGSDTPVANEAIGLHGATLIKGKGTTGSSLLSLYDNQGTPVKLWDFLDNGNVNLGVDSVVDVGTNTLSFISFNAVGIGDVNYTFEGRTVFKSVNSLSDQLIFEGRNSTGTTIFGLFNNGDFVTPTFYAKENTGGPINFLNVGRSAFKGNNTASNQICLEAQDSTGSRIFEVRNNGNLYTNGTVCFTGTGAYTNFTIKNGLITNAT